MNVSEWCLWTIDFSYSAMPLCLSWPGLIRTARIATLRAGLSCETSGIFINIPLPWLLLLEPVSFP